MTTGIRDVALLAGVSVGTVSNHLNHPERLAPETTKRIEDAIERLGYVPWIAGRHLRQGFSDVLGFIAPDVGNPHLAEIAEGMEGRAAELGMQLYLADSRHTREREDAYIRGFEELKVRGLLVASHLPIEDRLAEARQRGTVSVLIGQRALSPHQPSVSSDDAIGGERVVEHLLRIGCRRIMVAGGSQDVPQVAARLAGARTAVGRFGMGGSVEPVETADLTLEWGRRIGYEIVSRDPSARPDAVFAMNEQLALGCMQAAIAGGVQVPAELAIAGYDDTEFGRASLIPLTTVHVHADGLGAAAVDLLFEATAAEPAGAHKTVPLELVVRTSTAGFMGDNSMPPDRRVQ